MTTTELLLANVLDNPDDDLARFVFADYVIENDARNVTALARAELIVAQKNLKEAEDRVRELYLRGGDFEGVTTEAGIAFQAFNSAMRNPRLVLVPGCRADGATLNPRIRRFSPTTYDVGTGVRLGFVEHIRIHPEQLLLLPDDTVAGPHTALSVNPVKKIDVALSPRVALRVEIDRWHEGDQNDGWQVYFYRASTLGVREGDYLCMYSFQDRDEMVSSLSRTVVSVLIDSFETYLSDPLRQRFSRRLFPQNWEPSS